MTLLLDTHVWLWLQTSPHRIAAETLQLLEDPAHPLVLSAASVWEITIKHALGKLPLPEPPSSFVMLRLTRHGVRALAIEVAHTLAVADLPPLHADPFDRLLIAQARAERMTLVTADPTVLLYGGPMLRA
ncbi:MAG: type II toxin-antitoxin system VapC family toxin [Myxococcales bacterium]|nr:type II toxin-antitoxin system VapC family toxin [Myxococcales bacterium]